MENKNNHSELSEDTKKILEMLNTLSQADNEPVLTKSEYEGYKTIKEKDCICNLSSIPRIIRHETNEER